MGKTVEMIALFLANSPPKAPLPRVIPLPDSKLDLPCTLVVCPMSLLSQWRDEIARHSNLKCMLYYGSTGLCDWVPAQRTHQLTLCCCSFILGTHSGSV